MTNLSTVGAEVQRLTKSQIPLLAKFSQKDKQWWGGLATVARDALPPEEHPTFIKAVEGHLRTPSAVIDSYQDTPIMAIHDAIVPIQHRVDVDPVLRMDPRSRTNDDNIDLQAVAVTVPTDWRKEFFMDFQVRSTAAYARYCCGSKGVTGDVDLNTRASKSAWYTAAASFCWQDEAELSSCGLFDLIRLKSSLIIRDLNMARMETFFYGDPEIGIRGVANSDCERLMLATPLDQMSFNDAATMLNNIIYAQSLNGSVPTPFNKALLPQMWDPLMALRKPDLATAIAPVEYLQSAIGMSWKNIADKTTGYMQKVGRGANGRKNSPAGLLFNDNPNNVTRLLGTGVIWLPPCMDDGMIKIQAIIKVGDLRWHNPGAGLLIENMFTPSDYN